MIIKHFKRILQADVSNLFKYGFSMPGYMSRMNINPQEIKRRVFKIVNYREKYADITKMSGVVTDEHFWRGAEPIERNQAIVCSLRHWRDGMSWEDSGEIDRMMKGINKNSRKHIAGCRNLHQVNMRCAKLDEIFQTVKREARLRKFTDISHNKWLKMLAWNRELNGIVVHLGFNGELIFGSVGSHRLAMCLALKLKSIPVQVGLVHESSLNNFKLLRDKAS